MQSQAATVFYAPWGSKAEPWRAGLWVVLSAGLLYGLLHAVLRLALSTNLPQDDVTANILAQTLEPGYLPRQPPLYEWLLWTVQRVTGPTLPSFLFLKYALLTATLGFLYLIGLRIFTERKWAVLGALSPLLLFQIGWNLHEGVTHTMVMMCAVAASFWAFIRVVERGRVPDYILFGVLCRPWHDQQMELRRVRHGAPEQLHAAASLTPNNFQLAHPVECRRLRHRGIAGDLLGRGGPARSRFGLWAGRRADGF